MENKSKKWLKIVATAALLVVAIAFLWGQYQKMQPPARQRPAGFGHQAGERPGGGDGARGFERASPEERRQRHDEFLATANLSPEQRSQVEAIWKEYENVQGFEERREMRGRISQVLTEEQRKLLDGSRQARFSDRMNRAARVLPPKELEKLREKMDERMAERRNNGPRSGQNQQNQNPGGTNK